MKLAAFKNSQKTFIKLKSIRRLWNFNSTSKLCYLNMNMEDTSSILYNKVDLPLSSLRHREKGVCPHVSPQHTFNEIKLCFRCVLSFGLFVFVYKPMFCVLEASTLRDRCSSYFGKQIVTSVKHLQHHPSSSIIALYDWRA